MSEKDDDKDLFDEIDEEEKPIVKSEPVKVDAEIANAEEFNDDDFTPHNMGEVRHLSKEQLDKRGIKIDDKGEIDFGEDEGSDDAEEDEEVKSKVKSEDEIKKLEAKAVAESGDVGDIDNYIDNFKEPAKKKLDDEAKEARAKTKVKADAKVEEEKYKGPRVVKVYGTELYVEDDPNVTLDEVRKKIVDTYKFAEFSDDRTHMSFDKKTGIIVPIIKFGPKG